MQLVADFMVSSGLAALGYEYLNIDDCWNVGRFGNGTLMPDPNNFPNGIKPVADYVHSMVCATWRRRITVLQRA